MMRFIFADHNRAAQIERIREGTEAFRQEGRSDLGNFQMHEVFDEMLCQLGEHFLGYWRDDVAILGLGGYGRKEMSPYSDIDLMFLRIEDASEGLYRGIRSILYLLWDSRIEFGHSVRTVSECRQEGDNDLAVLTSLLDIRLVWGSDKLFRQLLIQVKSLVNEADPFELYFKIESEIRKSSNKFGQTIYLLEPHLKEGPGSLRYIQLITWLGKLVFGCSALEDLAVAGVCDPKSVTEVRAGMAFLAELRAGLHFLAGRRDDRLKFDGQLQLSEQMGFRDTPERRGVESFMREYYRHASNLDFFGRRIRAKARLFLRLTASSEIKRLRLDSHFFIGAGGVNHSYHYRFGHDPNELLLAFRKIADTGCDLDIRLVDLIRSKLDLISHDVLQSAEANRIVRPVDCLQTAVVLCADQGEKPFDLPW